MAVMARERRLAMPREHARRPDWQGMVGKAVVYALLIVAGGLFVAPFVWMVSGSVQQIGDIFRWPPQWIPRNPSLDNYSGLAACRPRSALLRARSCPGPHDAVLSI